ncbi:1-aminocyclopropane-1-carboxylate oxidase homolog isoform X1 [Cynara cardunculus var. scolymus]|uniref:Non-heme dioxygenase N-terminal domain-containing protein n=1 Tax=Cynara cardunculus var. scolymus TaxID=59895 RepID=A0A103XLX0_CYNCS|nr:1-aminocyclopropane-1-carboxylate oxidase homolog isoform X1 [Cynara cardunculus var. scolymus]KVH93170.1 Non-heme dioxygenase N-terminal domain-containing protein [Cynara cardunculus var. scolymus]
MTINGDDFDRKSELKAFDDTKGGVKGLVDSGITEVPRIFIQPPEVFPQANNTDFDLPIINLHGFISDPVRRKEIVKEVGEASRTWGFFQVINHGIPVSVMREMKDGVLRFFNQDHDLKKEWYVTDITKKFFYNSNVNLSCTLPVRWRDSFLCRMAPDPPNLHELPPPFRDILIEYSDQVTELGFLLFKLISEALGLDSNYLKEIGCADGLATICHYYPVSPQPELTIGAQKHADNGFLTVLLQDHIGGLQFLHRNQWLNVPFVPGALLVNIGDLLQLVSNDEFVSREHRVVSNGVSPRVSVACFFTTGMVSTGKIFAPITELLSEENPAKYRATTVAEFAQYSHSKALDKSCMLHFRI